MNHNKYILTLIESEDYSNNIFRRKINVALSGGGMAGCYQSGVIAYLLYLHHKKRLDIGQVYGTSAGAVAGVVLLYATKNHFFTIDDFMNMVHTQLLKEYEKERKYIANAWYNILEKILPDDIHLICTNKLHIGIMVQENIGFVQKTISEYDSKHHLLDTIFTSMSLPYLTIPTGYKEYLCPFTKKTYTAIDGIFTPEIQDTNCETLYINVFKHNYPLMKRLYPCESSYDFLVKEGIDNIHDFFHKKKQIPTLYFYKKKYSEKVQKRVLWKNVLIQLFVYSSFLFFL
jgi:hypothetical protein